MFTQTYSHYSPSFFPVKLPWLESFLSQFQNYKCTLCNINSGRSQRKVGSRMSILILHIFSCLWTLFALASFQNWKILNIDTYCKLQPFRRRQCLLATSPGLQRKSLPETRHYIREGGHWSLRPAFHWSATAVEEEGLLWLPAHPLQHLSESQAGSWACPPHALHCTWTGSAFSHANLFGAGISTATERQE